MQPGSLRRDRHHRLQLDTGRHRIQLATVRHRLHLAIQARVLALLPTFRPGILAAATVGTSSWRASPAMGNASVDDADAASTFKF
jgi:hypothetical protein